ncbi:MAG: hypothetical protein ACI32F_04160 [Allobaculum sp.]
MKKSNKKKRSQYKARKQSGKSTEHKIELVMPEKMILGEDVPLKTDISLTAYSVREKNSIKEEISAQTEKPEKPEENSTEEEKQPDLSVIQEQEGMPVTLSERPDLILTNPGLEELNREKGETQRDDMPNKINNAPDQESWSVDLPFDVFKAQHNQNATKANEAEISASAIAELDEETVTENLTIKEPGPKHEHAAIRPDQLLADALIRPHGLQSNDSNTEVKMGSTQQFAPFEEMVKSELARPVLKRSKPKPVEEPAEEPEDTQEPNHDSLMPDQQESSAERNIAMANTSDIKIWKNLLSDLQKSTEQNEVVMEEIEEEIALQEQRNKREVLQMYEKVIEQTHSLEKLLENLKSDTLFSLPEDVKTKESFIQSVEERLENSRKLAKAAEELLNTQTTTQETIENIRSGRRDERTSVRARFPREAILGNWIHYFTKDMFTCQCFWDDGEFKEYDFRDDRLVEERDGHFRVQNNQVLLDYDEGKQAIYTVTGFSDDCLDYLINKTSIRFDYMPEEALNGLLEGNSRR